MVVLLIKLVHLYHAKFFVHKRHERQAWMGHHFVDLVRLRGGHADRCVELDFRSLLCLAAENKLAVDARQSDCTLDQIKTSCAETENPKGVIEGSRPSHGCYHQATHLQSLQLWLLLRMPKADLAQFTELRLGLRAGAQALALDKSHLVLAIE